MEPRGAIYIAYISFKGPYNMPSTVSVLANKVGSRLLKANDARVRFTKRLMMAFCEPAFNNGQTDVTLICGYKSER